MFKKTILSVAAVSALAMAALAPTSASATSYGYGGGYSSGYTSHDTGYYFKRIRVPYYTRSCKYYTSYSYGYAHRVKRCHRVKHYKYITKKYYY